MDRLQELEIEVERLESQVAYLTQLITKLHGLTALGLVHNPRMRGRGRPTGSSRWSERVFVKELFARYAALPESRRTRVDVAIAMGISRRTLDRYLHQWDIAWPPDDSKETIVQVLARLARQKPSGATPEGPQGQLGAQPAAQGGPAPQRL